MNDLLERLLDEVQKEWGVGGLDSSTMYGEFAIEVAKRAVLAEREACANVAEEFEDDMGYGKAQKIADKIRMRSNAKSQATDAALSRQVACTDGLCPGASSENEK